MPVSIQALVAALGGPIVLFYVINWLMFKKRKSDIKGKVVLVTGANSGLGKACAFAFYRHGCNVILAGRNLQALESVKNDLEAMQQEHSSSASVLQLDLGQLDAIEGRVKEALDTYGQIDILVNNAGISYRGCIEDTDLSVHTKLMTVNYFGQIALTKAVLPSMLQAGGGHIVAVSTVQGRIAIPYRSAYAASKHALQAYFDSLRSELAGRNISVCVVSPGYIQTNLSQNALVSDGTSYGVLDQTTAHGLPPEKVAELVLDAVITHKTEVIPAPVLYKFVIVLRTLWPSMYFWVMARRAKKQRKDYIKQS